MGSGVAHSMGGQYISGGSSIFFHGEGATSVGDGTPWRVAPL